MTHLQVPLTLARNGSFATVDDGSPDDITQNVRAVLLTTPDTRLTDPDYGVDLLFHRDLAHVADEVRRFEPRAATVDIETVLDATGHADVTIRTGGSA